MSNRSLLSNEVRHIMQDSKGNIWIAESGAGFCICTPGNDYGKLNFTHYGVANGLVNSMVQAFVEDTEGKVWITTEYGVSCFFLAQRLLRTTSSPAICCAMYIAKAVR